MNVLSEIYKTLPLASISCPLENYFGYITSKIIDIQSIRLLEFTHCREVLHASFYYPDRMYPTADKLHSHKTMDENPFFYYRTLGKSFMVDIISKIEEKIGISNKSSIQGTDCKYVYAIFPGKFWMGHRLRFGLFTCFVRAAFKQEKLISNSVDKTIDHIIDFDPYLFGTKNSIIEFLAGNTFCEGYVNSCDWYFNMTQGVVSRPKFSDPTKFSHEEFIEKIEKFAKLLWEKGYAKIKGFDKELWLYAERITSLNAIR